MLWIQTSAMAGNTASVRRDSHHQAWPGSNVTSQAIPSISPPSTRPFAAAPMDANPGWEIDSWNKHKTHRETEKPRQHRIPAGKGDSPSRSGLVLGLCCEEELVDWTRDLIAHADSSPAYRGRIWWLAAWIIAVSFSHGLIRGIRVSGASEKGGRRREENNGRRA
ncbi:hypothetical protein F5884DRAFT_182876 [Xylogone sp. PMI_703]|nr:hypothetical protein F5884DRAFT_182876 [Xylogone sp. PMI_703]